MIVPSMSQRHFEFIAAIVSKFGTHMGPLGVVNMTPAERESVAKFIAGELRASNGRFNPSRFLRACGVEE